MEDRICSFFGHSELEITNEIYTKTAAAITKAVDDGFRYFYFGGFGAFDDLCHKIVSDIRAAKPELGITRTYIACSERDVRKPKVWMNSTNYEEITVLPITFDYWYTRIYYRNCAIIDRSDLIIFYAEERNNSGAYKAYKYAKTRKKDIILINE
jgi:hypothetical protein